MKIGKKEKIYGALLGVAFAGFTIDRLFFTPAESQGAEVATAPPASKASEPASVQPDTAAPAAAPAGWVAERLRSLPSVSDNELTNVFAAPASWRPAPKLVAAAVEQPQVVAEHFARDHRLVAVILDGNGGRAVIDDRIVLVGAFVDGCRLMSVNSRSARFVRDGEVLFLTLANSDAASVR